MNTDDDLAAFLEVAVGRPRPERPALPHQGVTMTFPSPEIEHADTAYESIRAINHLTITTHAIPAPEMYAILGNLKSLGYALDQALRQLCSALQLSLDTFDVYETDGADPVTRAGWAIGDMTAAADRAADIGELLSSAQSEVARQAYNQRPVPS